MQPDGSGVETFADTGGRPLGLAWAADGRLIVADAARGLLSVSDAGAIRVLSTEAGGVPFGSTDDVDVAPDGTIYFSDASRVFDQQRYTWDLVESFVLGNETSRYRVRRYWLTGERRGESEVIIDNLPGFPDGISSNGAGTYWLAIVSPRNALLDALAPHPFLRKTILRLPEAVQPAPVRYGFVLGLDGSGKLLHNLQSPSGEPFALITSVEQVGGMLLSGSLEEPALARIAAPR
jgi:sugar lactone lactonase YvrE